MQKVVLLIIDGYGYSIDPEGNAVTAAEPLFLTQLALNHPSYLLNASGVHVGLPPNQPGNSEVGHLTIGAGRIIKQEIIRISDCIANKELSCVLNDGGLIGINRLHFVGLVSDGGVHSHISILKELLLECKNRAKEIFLHFISDGRDTSPRSVEHYFNEISSFMDDNKLGVVASIGGRFYCMDRNKNEDRIDKAFNCMTRSICNGDKRINEDFICNGDKRINEDFICNGDKRVDEESICNGDKRIDEELNYNGDKRIDKELYCNGDKRVDEESICNGDKRIDEELNYNGDKRINEELNYNGDKRINEDFICNGDKRIGKESICNGDKRILNIEDKIRIITKDIKSDEFIEPTLLYEQGVIKKEDSILFFNYRADRMKQIFKRFESYKTFTLTEFDKNFKTTVLFKKIELKNTISELVSRSGKTQSHVAETEKYAHVTYFFNGGSEVVYENEYRFFVPSPSVEKYDDIPGMAMHKVTDKVVEEIEKGVDLIVLNLAAPDMVGHTGNFSAAVEAVKITDECVKRIYDKVQKKEYVFVITADHGNVENMIENGNMITKHTANKVPLIICKGGNKNGLFKDEGGSLKDVAPNVLKLLEIEINEDMEGTAFDWI